MLNSWLRKILWNYQASQSGKLSHAKIIKYITADKVKTGSLTNTSNMHIIPIKYATLELLNETSSTDLQRPKKTP